MITEQNKLKENTIETDEMLKKIFGGVLIAAFIGALKILNPFRLREEALEDKNTVFYLIGLLIMVVIMHLYLKEGL